MPRYVNTTRTQVQLPDGTTLAPGDETTLTVKKAERFVALGWLTRTDNGDDDEGSTGDDD